MAAAHGENNNRQSRLNPLKPKFELDTIIALQITAMLDIVRWAPMSKLFDISII
jgi:hypothetical protein